MYTLTYDDKRGELGKFASEDAAKFYLNAHGYKYRSWDIDLGEVWGNVTGDILFLSLSSD